MSELISTKKLNQKAYSYIISCIDNSGYSENKLITDKDRLQFLSDTFKVEGTSYTQKSFEVWIQGIPSCFKLVFMNYDIIMLAKDWGSLKKDATEREEDKILNNYWNFITVKTFQLFRKYKIN